MAKQGESLVLQNVHRVTEVGGDVTPLLALARYLVWIPGPSIYSVILILTVSHLKLNEPNPNHNSTSP